MYNHLKISKKIVILIVLGFAISSCSLYESEGRKILREQGISYTLSSLGTVDNCLVTDDSISEEFSEVIDANLAVLETSSADYYFIYDGPHSFVISCDTQNLIEEQSYFLNRYSNDKTFFWNWVDEITQNFGQ